MSALYIIQLNAHEVSTGKLACYEMENDQEKKRKKEKKKTQKGCQQCTDIDKNNK